MENGIEPWKMAQDYRERHRTMVNGTGLWIMATDRGEWHRTVDNGTGPWRMERQGESSQQRATLDCGW